MGRPAHRNANPVLLQVHAALANPVLLHAALVQESGAALAQHQPQLRWAPFCTPSFTTSPTPPDAQRTCDPRSTNCRRQRTPSPSAGAPGCHGAAIARSNQLSDQALPGPSEDASGWNAGAFSRFTGFTSAGTQKSLPGPSCPPRWAPARLDKGNGRMLQTNGQGHLRSDLGRLPGTPSGGKQPGNGRKVDGAIDMTRQERAASHPDDMHHHQALPERHHDEPRARHDRGGGQRPPSCSKHGVRRLEAWGRRSRGQGATRRIFKGQTPPCRTFCPSARQKGAAGQPSRWCRSTTSAARQISSKWVQRPRRRWLQCHPALHDDWLEALRRAGKPTNKERHIKWVRGKKCSVAKRTIISQGHAASSDLFTERVGFMQNEPSQKAGIRVVPQINGLSIWTKGGLSIWTKGGPLANCTFTASAECCI